MYIELSSSGLLVRTEEVAVRELSASGWPDDAFVKTFCTIIRMLLGTVWQQKVLLVNLGEEQF